MALTAKVFRANGTVEDLGVVSLGDVPLSHMLRQTRAENTDKLLAHAEERQAARVARYWWLVVGLIIGVVCTAFASYLQHLWFGLFVLGPVVGIVTTAGVAYMAADFASGGVSPRISAFNFQDSGTGTNAAATTDTALQTPTGGARVAGTQTTPGSTNVYKTVATISYTSTLAITEWGLFSASSSGTLWDRRVFSAINVLNGDAIQFSYSLTIPAGGT
jgi:hypothetical protein